ncbi:MAG: S46 family peptidase [Longimicrobiales bacterium]
MTFRRPTLGALSLFLATATALAAQDAPPLPEVGEFDFGKMWTFEYPPVEHFQNTYGVDASPEWFEQIRMAALRIPGCSASFVSPHGLVVTNHHCARGSIAAVTRDGENLLDDGFVARTLDDERPIPDTYADQLLAALDVTAELESGVERGEIEARLQTEYGADVRVQFVPLYNGGRTSAYVIRRFTDVRLVAAVELGMGFFGGDPDNFTYPRYALDYAFYRVYDDDGTPFETDHWFRWGNGVEEGEPIFMVGNPGPTNRLLTVAQLEYQRDVLVPGLRAWFDTRLGALRDAYAADPDTGERLGLRNQAFSLSNSLKAYTGRLSALQDPEIMRRKEAAEVALIEDAAGAGVDEDRVTELLDSMAELQTQKRALGDATIALFQVGNGTYGSRALLRGLRVAQMNAAQAAGRESAVAEIRTSLLSIDDHPGDLEEDLLALRLRDLERYLGADDPLVASTLEGRSPEGAATVLVRGSVLASQADVEAALDAGGVPADDPLARLATALLPRLIAHQQATAPLDAREEELDATLGRLRFDVYGTRIAPDATSSPRITDGVVRGYDYNGTRAPTHTTLYGIYDRYHSHLGSSDEWLLPGRWLPVPEGLDLSTPLNFVSTTDSYGGNSGSPALTRDLEIVGLNFDRNIEGLSRDFIYLPDQGRNVMVDVRAIRHTLDVVYDADRIVLEIDTGTMAETEQEADRIRAGGGG